MTAIEVLEKWAKFSNYDPDNKKFILDGFSYDVQKGNDLISKLSTTYDNTGGLSVVFAKILCNKILMGNKSTYYEILSNPDKYNESKEMWDLFNSKDIIEIEDNYIYKLNEVVYKILSGKAIGDYEQGFDKGLLFNAIEVCINSLEKCSLDVFLKSNEKISIAKISTHIHVFNTLAECLTALESTEDGMYLCYVNANASLDGYFGFYIKSNGNIISVNERIDEAYAGSHKNSRNGRYAENKQFEMFPYDFIFDFEGHDYKGYATKYIIDDEKLDFFNLGIKAYIPIVLAMFLLKSKYDGRYVEGDIIYVDSLVNINIQKNISSGCESLSIINNSQLVESHNNLDINFEIDKVLDGTYHSEYDHKDNKDKTYKETGTFTGENDIFVELYAEGFTFNNESLLETNQHLKKISKTKSNEDFNSDIGVETEQLNSEFVGTKARLELQAYYNVRMQLADFIKSKMKEELKKFDKDRKEMNNWYLNLLKEHSDNIYNIIFEYELKVENGEEKRVEAGWHNTKSNSSLDIWRVENTYPSSGWSTSSNIVLNKPVDNGRYHPEKWYDKSTGNICNIFYIIQPRDWTGIEGTIEGEVPKIIKGWKYNRQFSGNPILDAVDPVARIETPFERTGGWNCSDNYFNFNFAVGFSKRGFNKDFKEWRIKHEQD